MGYVVNIDSENQQAINLVNFLKTLDFVSVEKIENKAENILSEPEKKFLERLSRSAKQAKNIAKGKEKGNPISELLDEI